MKGDLLKMCNCAACGKELLGACHELWYWRLPERKREALPPLVAGRIHGRPYCRPCLATRPPRGKAERGENPNPWTENAVRTMEDGR